MKVFLFMLAIFLNALSAFAGLSEQSRMTVVPLLKGTVA
jgi:hypothetical protein